MNPLSLGDEPSFYDTLEVPLDASQNEVRASYLRMKAAYSRESVALYSLLTKEETEEMLKKIEIAYQVLSHPEKRKAYDQNFGDASHSASALASQAHAAASFAKVISIDRSSTPLADNSHRDDEDLLVAPSTDFTQKHEPQPERKERIETHSHAPSHSSSPNSMPYTPEATVSNDAEIQSLIAAETEWSGPSLRKIRELKKISIEELSDFTKISKTYLIAIEEEVYEKLPVSVYLRGFITQMAKRLKLPHDKVASQYLVRFRLKCPERA